MKISLLLLSIYFLSYNLLGQTELITNAGFEQAAGPQSVYSWNFTSNYPGFYVGIGFPNPHSGSNYAYVGADINGTKMVSATGVLSQSVLIPNGATTATVRFWLKITTDEPPTTVDYDFLGVYLAGVNLLGFSNRSTTGVYEQKTSVPMNVAQYQGQYISLSFSEVSNGTYPTVFRIDDVSLQVTIAQPILSVTPDNQNVSSSSGTTNFSVSNTGAGTMNWNASASSSGNWLTITSGSSGTNSGTINCSYQANTGTTQRVGTINITSTGSSGSPKSVTVTQNGNQVQPILSVTPDNQNVNSSPGMTTFSVSNTGTGTMSWSSNVTSGSNWLTITNGGAGTNSGTISCSYQSNPNTSQRIATVTITATGSTGSPKNVTVTQNGAQLQPILSVTPDNQNVNSSTGTTNFNVSNTGSGTMSWNSIVTSGSSWLTITNGGSGTDNGTINCSYQSNIGSTQRVGTITITSAGTTGSPKNVSVTQTPNAIVVGNLKITGDQITGSAPNYTISGNINIGHINQTSYLITNLDATLSCNTSTSSINVTSGGSTFTINGAQGWNWNFSQTQSWSFNPGAGTVNFNSHLNLNQSGTLTLLSSSYKLNFFNKTIDGAATFDGDNYLQNIGSIQTSINLAQISLAFEVSIGTYVPLGKFRLGILPNSAGISFNLLQQKINFDANIGDLITLDLVGVDGVDFSFSPAGSISLGVEWNITERRMTFYKDTKISLPGLGKIIPDSMYNKLLENKQLHYGTGLRKNQLILDAGLTIKEGSYIDFDNLILSGTATIDIGWHDLSVTVASCSLSINYQDGYIFGQVLVPGIKIAENIHPGGWFDSDEITFNFAWGNKSLNKVPKFTFIGKLRGLLPLLPSIDVNIVAILGSDPVLFGKLRACMGWKPLQFCAGADVLISSEGLRIDGYKIPPFGLYKSTSSNSSADSVSILADPYSNTVSGYIINESTVPQTNIRVNPKSPFNIIYNPAASNYGDLHLSSIVDGTNLSWNYRDNSGQLNATLSNFEGISVALASKADLKIESNINPNKYIEIKNNGGITLSHFTDGFSYFSPDSTLGVGRIWKIIRIYPKDSTESFLTTVTPIDIQDSLIFTLIKKDPSVSEGILFTRYHSEKMTNKNYILNIKPGVMDYSFSNGSDIITPNSMDQVSTENGLLYLSQIQDSWAESSFRINWNSSVPTNYIVRYGPSINDAIYNQSNSQMSTQHDVFIAKTSVDTGWVYQIQCTNIDSEKVFSEWRLITPGAITSINDKAKVPDQYNLLQNYPNPFNPNTIIRYALPQNSTVKIIIYNLLGEVVKEMINGIQEIGTHEISFSGDKLASGIYIYSLQANSIDGKQNFMQVKKMILLK